MDERFFIVHYFFVHNNAEDSLYTRQFTIAEPFFSFWRFGLGFIFRTKRKSHNGRRILFLPDGINEKNEVEYPIDLYFRIFSGTFPERSFGQRHPERNYSTDGLQKTGRQTSSEI